MVFSDFSQIEIKKNVGPKDFEDISSRPISFYS